MRRVLLLFAVALVAGCDSGSDEVAFRGVTVETRGDASLTVDGDALVVTGIGPGRSGGFTIPGNASRVDVEIDPLAIPAGARFGIEVEDASGNDIASFYNVGNDLGGVDFVFDFPASTGLEAVRLTYRIGGEGGRAVFSDVLELVLPRQTVARLPPTSGGSGSGSTTSTHVIREGGRYIVVSDSDPPQNTRLGCAGFVATLGFGDISGGSHELSELGIGQFETIDGKRFHGDSADWTFFRIVFIAAHAEGSSRQFDHTAIQVDALSCGHSERSFVFIASRRQECGQQYKLRQVDHSRRISKPSYHLKRLPKRDFGADWRRSICTIRWCDGFRRAQADLESGHSASHRPAQ